MQGDRREPRVDFPFVGIASFLRSAVQTDLGEMDADVAVMGVPSDEGSPFMPGSRFGQRAIRENSLRFATDPTGYFDPQERRRFLEREMRDRRLVDVGDADVRIRCIRGSQVMQEDTTRDGNRLVTMEEFRDASIDAVLVDVPAGEACYVSIDIDVLDLALVPGCVSAEPNGMQYSDLREGLFAIAEHAEVVGFDLVEVNSQLDVGTEVTSYLAAHTVIEFLGRICAQSRWIEAHERRTEGSAG